MAKKKVLPKQVAGLKVPKSLRKSRLLRSLLASPMGREIVANAVTAGAGAAATVLIQQREEIADAGTKGARRGARTLGIVTEAVEEAATAVMDVVADAARSVIPEDRPKKAKRPASKPRSRKGTRATATRH